MNEDELHVLLSVYVDAHLNGETAMDYGYFLVSEALRPFLPNCPAIVEVLRLNPEYMAVFGQPQPSDDMNILKSEKTTDIPSLNLDPRKPGGSRETAIELIPEDEANPESLQNTPFANVVLPRRRNEEPPPEVRLAENPWDVALMDPKDVPWHTRFPPRLDIPIERRYYHDFHTGAFMSSPFAGQLLERAVEVVSATYNGVMGERAKYLWAEEIKPGDKCDRCFLEKRDCTPALDENDEVYTPNCAGCKSSHYNCSNRIQAVLRDLSEWTYRRFPVSQQDLFDICRRWGLIAEHHKDGLFSLVLVKGKGKKANMERILRTPTGPNFDEFNRARLRRGLRAQGIFNIEY
ncbi:hypothetical protein AAF712_013859 [Marasmius tenuissimus]|uniref:Uncharacterized protein n=1 Tax=Marasmius tenuissimus TaxID=585030 RepID=A0ABR2ZF54_9AGAR